ncbi:MAG TPA: hypothetical protein VGD40_15305 [Chryseosolibacter sp.]
MQDVLMPISIIGSFGVSLYFFTKVLTDYILKKKMIEKGYVSDETQAIFRTGGVPSRYGSLKWGLITLLFGVSLILIDYLDLRASSPSNFGIVAIAISIAFLAYFYIAKREVK